MASRGKRCGRCFTPTAATTTERISFGNSAYDLDLCDPHADMMRRDLYGWTRCGTLVEEYRAFPSPVREPQSRGREPQSRGSVQGRGTVQVAYVHVPVAREPEPEPEPVAAPRRPRLQRSLLPVGSDEWRFSEHALERREARGVGREEALLAALAPEVARPGKKEGTFVHVRDWVHVVVDPGKKLIITVVNRKQELVHAAS